LNGHELVSTPPRQSQTTPSTDANHFVLTFENNRFASELFGQYDQNLKLIEQRLHVDARPRGNSVAISGEVTATNQARRALDYLYGRLQKMSRARSAWRSPPMTSCSFPPWRRKPS
jgi:phosphate starvation-inducible PhoH-like protein